VTTGERVLIIWEKLVSFEVGVIQYGTVQSALYCLLMFIIVYCLSVLALLFYSIAVDA